MAKLLGISKQEQCQYLLLQIVLRSQVKYGFRNTQLTGSSTVSRPTLNRLKTLRYDPEHGVISDIGTKKRAIGNNTSISLHDMWRS